jgi:hypothetical protein
VCAFHLPLAVLKPVDMMNLNANMILFAATFFMALFSAKVCRAVSLFRCFPVVSVNLFLLDISFLSMASI